MDESRAAETRQRVINYIEETGALLGMIPRLLDENERLRAEAEAAVRESHQLRGEVDDLRGEVQRLQTDRDEIAQSVARVMSNLVGVVNEILPKLRSGGGPPGSDIRPHGRPSDG
jgi:predicted RNase H-like nuclease (RuvC/YqgF family)